MARGVHCYGAIMATCRHCNGSKNIPLFTGVSPCPWCSDDPMALSLGIAPVPGGTIKGYLRHVPGNNYGQRSAITLEDGSTVSVQASENHYCEPRQARATAYTMVEVGFPKHADGTPWELATVCPELAPFEDYPGSHVYGYVPVEVLEAVILRHGGIK